MKKRSVSLLISILLFAILSVAALALTTVTLNLPLNNTFISGSTYIMNATTDEIANVTFYYYNGTTITTIYTNDSSLTDLTFIWDTTALTDGSYNISANATNGTLANVSIMNYNITIDNTNPTVDLNLPSTNTWNTDSTVLFGYTPTDDNLQTCILYHNATGSWAANNTNTSLTSGVQINNSWALSDGYYSWNALCNDSAGNTAWAAANFTINVDANAPTATLDAPATGSYDTDGTITISYTPTDINLANCTLYHNFTGTWTANITNTSLTSGTQVNNIFTLADGYYMWNVLCNDSADNSAFNSTGNFTINVDTANPSVTPTIPETATWYNSDFNITATMTDTGVISSGSYRVLNSTGQQVKDWTALQAVGDTYNATFDITSISDATNCTFIFNATDSAGQVNTSENVTTVHIDDTNPSVGYINVSSITSSGGTLTINVTDNLGVNACTYSGAGTGAVTISTAPNYTATLTGLSASTTYNVSVNCTDMAGNFDGSQSLNFTTIAATTTTTTTTTTSTSTSGSGGSISRSLSGQFAQQVWGHLEEGEIAELPIDNGEIGFTKVEFKTKKELYSSNMKVIKVVQLPSNVDSHEKPAYKYIEIRTGNLEEKNIEEAKINFKVAKSWLTENNLNQENIALFRHVNENWIQLTTTLGQDDGEFIHYTASTPGFSYFAIAASEEPAAPAPTEPTIETPEET
ncbi:MAG: PGF-pre-PGF domain-containing protein, partial [Nanoarchaeota archaeon]|nr:PGF-pre-PGF domain-containing protein [Nanoarchaeota archaeon]